MKFMYRLKQINYFIFFLGTLAASVLLAQENPPPYKIYLNADQSNNSASGKSIELGIRTALEGAQWKLAGHPVELVIKDHHGSSPRSRFHLEEFLKDPQALLVFGGLHSPPLIQDREFINNEKILTLVPWAAAGPITRPYSTENWIFRLSLDDSKASKIIIQHAILEKGCQSPALLLEDTSWGIANELNMKRTLNQLDIKAIETLFFKWGIGLYQAKFLLDNAVSDGADCFVLVANAPEGITFAEAMLSLPQDKQRPIQSHWGITGGNFTENLSPSKLASLNLNFIQTRFSFFEGNLSQVAKEALRIAGKLMHKHDFDATDLKAPAGFIHAFDLTKILIAAADQANLTGNIATDRLKLKAALEDLVTPVEGLIKTYQRPFQAYVLENQDAHEALTERDFVMAFYDTESNIRLLPNRQK